MKGGSVTTAILVICTLTPIGTLAQNFRTLASFEGPNGDTPYLVALIQGRDGYLYGTTFYGGSTNNPPPGLGTAFKVMRDGSVAVLYDFCTLPNCADGGTPASGLIQGTDGNLYGTTAYGGANSSAGTVFKLTTAGVLTTLYSFCALPNCADGSGGAGLVEGYDGNLYGFTTFGGDGSCDGGCGTVFKITPAGKFETLHLFNGNDGAYPRSAPLQASGDFYGTTQYGGTYNLGTVFKISPTGVLATVHNFAGSDGSLPTGGLIESPSGNLLGTTTSGGKFSQGTVFAMPPSGRLHTIYNFCSQQNCADGASPVGGVVMATDHNLYGSAAAGGQASGADCSAAGCGTVFKLTPSGTLITLHAFTGYPTDGAWPYGSLLQATNGSLYATTSWGGDVNDGTIFSLDIGTGPFVAFVQAAGNVGRNAEILGQGFTGTTNVSFNGVPANFTVKSDTFLTATVPTGATTGYVTVSTPSGTLTSNVPFNVIP